MNAAAFTLNVEEVEAFEEIMNQFCKSIFTHFFLNRKN